MALTESTLADGIGTIVLNNSQKRNALSAKMIESAVRNFEEFHTQRARVVVLRAPKGTRVFSAGHDVTELPQRGRDPLGYNDPLERLIRTIRHSTLPVICMIEGSVWGGACEVCFACDIINCEENVTFALTPAKLGVPYNTTGLLNLRNVLGGRLAREMLFAAQPVSAARLHSAGIINYLWPSATLEESTYALAEQMTKNSPLSISSMKEQLRILENASPFSPETFERLQALRRDVYDSLDYEEGLRAFVEKRTPKFTGE